MQLDFFEDNSEIGMLRQELLAMKESQRKQSRAQFGKIHNAFKEILKIHEELDRTKALLLKRQK